MAKLFDKCGMVADQKTNDLSVKIMGLVGQHIREAEPLTGTELRALGEFLCGAVTSSVHGAILRLQQLSLQDCKPARPLKKR